MATTAAAPSLNDCLKLLRGERDEQKLAGLLLATKFCQGDDTDSIVKVYQAVGFRFLRRLLMTGMGNEKGGEDKEVYLRLSVTVLAAFSRVSEIASLTEMVDMVPLVAEIVSKLPEQSVAEECFEFLLLIAMASEQGITKFYEPKVMDALASNISTLPDESKSLELSTRLLQLLVNKLNVDVLNTATIQGVASMVVCLARLFCVLHNAIKFDALHMLSSLLSLKNLLLYDALRTTPRLWAAHIRVGITSVLQNRIVSSEKLQALLLADCMMSILGEDWLLQECDISSQKEVMPVDKFVLLILESARVEIAVLLNELAYLKYDESPKSSTSRQESIQQKQRSLAIAFSLLEKFIKMISSGAEGQVMRESTIMKAISGLNETIGIVLDFLQDSKDHNQRKGDDLLAAVRIIGSYLAEAPHACKDKTTHLLGYILSLEGQDESSPFYSVCFMLPMLSQITLEADGCRTLASFEGYKTVADSLLKLIELDQVTNEDAGTIVLACDTIINFLSNKKSLQIQVDNGLLKILRVLPLWAVQSSDPSLIVVASGVCALILELTSEEFLLSHCDFDISALESLSYLIVASLDQKIGENDKELLDQQQMIISAYRRWAVKFPIISRIVQQAMNV
ncbi:neurochondrin family protein [Carex rostrata]